jgi:hypothetical protein
MALNPDQVSDMLKMMSEQMKNMQILSHENQALQLENRTLQEQRQHEGAGTTKRRPPERPSIETNADDSDWALFLDSWERYKKMTKLQPGQDTILELRAACSQEVNKLLFEFIGAATLNSSQLDEKTLLGHIQSVSVRGVHKEVHRMNFSKLTQSNGETITHFVSRLNSKASLCDFHVQCSCTTKVPFAEEMVSQQLVAGLRNQDHQAKILGEAATLTTLSQKVDRLVSLETAEDATSTMHGSSEKTVAAAARYSDYKRQNTQRQAPRTPWRPKPSKDTPWKSRTTTDKRYDTRATRPCRGCGLLNHPDGKSRARQDCPAYDKKCDSCGRIGHLKSVCESSNSRSKATRNDDEQSDATTDEESLQPSFSFMTRTPIDGSGFQEEKGNQKQE